MEQSILISTKKILGIGPDDASFDLDVLAFINSAFSTLHQVGIGPVDGFVVEDEEAKWTDFIQGFPEFIPYVGLIQTCIYLQVRVLFDPPTTSYLIGAMEKQLEEHIGRLSTAREGAQWSNPAPTPVPDIIDGDAP